MASFDLLIKANWGANSTTQVATQSLSLKRRPFYDYVVHRSCLTAFRVSCDLELYAINPKGFASKREQKLSFTYGESSEQLIAHSLLLWMAVP